MNVFVLRPTKPTQLKNPCTIDMQRNMYDISLTMVILEALRGTWSGGKRRCLMNFPGVWIPKRRKNVRSCYNF